MHVGQRVLLTPSGADGSVTEHGVVIDDGATLTAPGRNGGKVRVFTRPDGTKVRTWSKRRRASGPATHVLVSITGEYRRTCWIETGRLLAVPEAVEPVAA